MYWKHDLFENPENENIRIWRYLDFEKFIYLLERRALFFCRADRFEDKFEGSIPNATIQLRQKNSNQNFQTERSSYTQKFREVVLINCWNMNEYESAAMWKLYLKGDNGIAIQSTFKKFVHCFDGDTQNIVYIGKVKYIDYKFESFQEGNIFQPYLFKGKEFEHERELRAIILYPDANVNRTDFLSKDFDFNGIDVPIEPETLIESVYISPNSQEWFSQLVCSIMKKYDFQFPPTPSRLSENPSF